MIGGDHKSRELFKRVAESLTGSSLSSSGSRSCDRAEVNVICGGIYGSLVAGRDRSCRGLYSPRTETSNLPPAIAAFTITFCITYKTSVFEALDAHVSSGQRSVRRLAEK